MRRARGSAAGSCAMWCPSASCLRASGGSASRTTGAPWSGTAWTSTRMRRPRRPSQTRLGDGRAGGSACGAAEAPHPLVSVSFFFSPSPTHALWTRPRDGPFRKKGNCVCGFFGLMFFGILHGRRRRSHSQRHGGTNLVGIYVDRRSIPPVLQSFFCSGQQSRLDSGFLSIKL